MKKIGLLLVMAMTLTMVQGQQNDDKIRQAKHKYLTEKIELGADQKDEFWKLYSEYNVKKRDLRITMSQNRLGLRKSSNSEKESRDILKSELDLKQAMLDLEKEYVKKYESVLSVKQIIALYKAEDDFNKVLMQRLRRGDGNRGSGNGQDRKPGNGKGN